MNELERKLAVECFYLPSFPIAAASVNVFYGSVHFTMKTTFEVTYSVLESLCFMGFRNIAVIASHADPQHQIAVERAVRKINKKNGLCAVAPMGQIFMGVSEEKSQRLAEFEKAHANDYHAGWIETSSLLDIDPRLVRSCYQTVPDSIVTDRDMISVRRQTAAMGEYGHIGAPRYASRELGKDLNNSCIATICDAVEKFYKRDGYQRYEHYPLYRILPLHIGFIDIFGKVRRKKVS